MPLLNQAGRFLSPYSLDRPLHFTLWGLDWHTLRTLPWEILLHLAYTMYTMYGLQAHASSSDSGFVGIEIMFSGHFIHFHETTDAAFDNLFPCFTQQTRIFLKNLIKSTQSTVSNIFVSLLLYSACWEIFLRKRCGSKIL